MTAPREEQVFFGCALGVGLFYALVIFDQLSPGATAAGCWFYSETLGERSLSELLTVVALLGAAATAGAIARARRSRFFLLFAIFSLALALEEANYGIPYFTWLRGLGYDEGTSLHNLVEKKYEKEYWSIEGIVQVGIFAVFYALWPLHLAFRENERRPWRVATALVPGVVWGLFLWKAHQWERAMGVPLYPNHPCVSIDEEIYESLFAVALLGFALQAAGALLRHRGTVSGPNPVMPPSS